MSNPQEVGEVRGAGRMSLPYTLGHGRGPANIPDEDGMQRYCLDRHKGRINAVFFDFTVRPVGLKELWILNWHKGYNRAGPWTRIGGITPNDWPDWMREFKDY